jgi:hypothetical protein
MSSYLLIDIIATNVPGTHSLLKIRILPMLLALREHLGETLQ